MDYKQFTLSQEERRSIPEKLLGRVELGFSLARDWEGRTACNGLRLNVRGYPVKTCHLMDPHGHVAEWRKACLEADQENKQLQEQLARLGWQPIEDAPKDSTLVDLWVPEHTPQRLVDMRRVDYGNGNVCYENMSTGETCDGTPTHFKFVDEPVSI